MTISPSHLFFSLLCLSYLTSQTLYIWSTFLFENIDQGKQQNSNWWVKSDRESEHQNPQSTVHTVWVIILYMLLIFNYFIIFAALEFQLFLFFIFFLLTILLLYAQTCNQIICYICLINKVKKRPYRFL